VQEAKVRRRGKGEGKCKVFYGALAAALKTAFLRNASLAECVVLAREYVPTISEKSVRDFRSRLELGPKQNVWRYQRERGESTPSRRHPDPVLKPKRVKVEKVTATPVIAAEKAVEPQAPQVGVVVKPIERTAVRSAKGMTFIMEWVVGAETRSMRLPMPVSTWRKIRLLLEEDGCLL